MVINKKCLIWAIITAIFALAINAYIIMHSCLDAGQSTEASRGVIDVTEEVINTVVPNTITPENHDSFALFIRKAFGHFGLFVISGLLTSLAVFLGFTSFNNRKYLLMIIISFGVGLSIGILTEVIQLSVPGRSGEFTDVLIDFSGYILGFSIVFLIVFLVLRQHSKKQKQTNESVTA